MFPELLILDFKDKEGNDVDASDEDSEFDDESDE